MKVIGLCGQSGAGKGLVCSFFEELNVTCIDTDKIYHNIISIDSDCTKELVALFGNDIYANPGIDRKALRKVVFSSDENLKKLNAITHRHILENVREQIKTIKSSAASVGIIIDAPLLFESGFDKECDATIAVITDEESKIQRIINRDNITKEVAQIRISSQMKDDDLINRCTYVIVNDSTEEDLKDKVYKLQQIIFD